jgi:adenine-specific DNA-methyltransferase
MPTLHWIGKDKVIHHHMDVPFKVLEHSYGFDNGTQKASPVGGGLEGAGNKIIHGDNLEALKALLPEYEGKVKCIYIDPPYNTGNESWVYNDNVNDPKIKKWLGQVVGKEAEDLTRHDKWLCMMYPRLKLLHKLLADDGAIFISIDDNEQANLKLVMDEIFGSGNFVRAIACVNNPKGRSDDKYIATAHETILSYRKTKELLLRGFEPDEKITKRYNKKDTDGVYREIDLRKTGDGDTREDRPNMFYSFIFNKKTNEFIVGNLDSEIGNEYIVILPMKSEKEDGRWRWGIENAKENIHKLFPKYMPSKKQWSVFEKDYLENRNNLKPTSVWDFKEVNSERGTETFIKYLGFEKKDFPNPKPVGTIERILSIATDKDAIILDSFAGSGTTAHAVLNLNKKDGGNRKFILIEMEDYAETITAERVKRVIKGYGSAGSPQAEGTGGSFDFYELGQPMFLEDGNLNEMVGVEKIRKYIYYTETKSHYSPPLEGLGVAFLGKHNDTAYYFNYEQDEVTTLDHAFLATMKTKAEQYVIYADNCLLTKDYMTKFNIIFKKIPRDITKF